MTAISTVSSRNKRRQEATPFSLSKTIRSWKSNLQSAIVSCQNLMHTKSKGKATAYATCMATALATGTKASWVAAAILTTATGVVAGFNHMVDALTAKNRVRPSPQKALKREVVRFAVTTGCIAALSVAGLFSAVKFQDNQNRSTPKAEQAIGLVKSGITLKQGHSFKDQMKPGSPTFKNVSISKRGDVPWYFDANKGSHYLISFDVPHAYTDILTGKNKASYRMTVGVGKTEVDTVDSDSKGTIWSFSAKAPNLAPEGNPSYDEGSFRRAAPIQQCVGPADPTCKYN